VRIDSLVMHTEDVMPGDGAEFYGTPIRTTYITDSDVREELDTQIRARLGLGIVSVPAELLPGEVLKDNVIRRETAAEVVGEDFYKQEDGEEGISGLQSPDYWDNYTERCAC
jgi:hypothetical protein